MSKYLEGARQKLEEAALNYARMKASGHYLERRSGESFIVRVCGSDRDSYLDMFTKNTLMASCDLLDEMMAADLPKRTT